MGGTMKSNLYYFSATGNTKFAADKLQEQFKKYGKDLELINIENVDKVDLTDCEYLIIGTPVHSEMPPRIITDFINNLPEGNSKLKCMVYSTQGANGTAAVEFLKRILNKKGYEVLIQTCFRMANNYYFGFGVERTDEEIAAYSRKVEEKAKLIVQKLLKDERHKEGALGIRVFIGKVMANGFHRMLPKLSSVLTSTEQCMKCGLCLRNCPKNNITIEEGHATFHSQCIMCTRCIHICPVNAIRYKGKKITQNQKSLIKYLELK